MNDELERRWEGIGHDLILRYYPIICWTDWEKVRKLSASLACPRADILNRDLPNTKQEC
jgi:hypothetical protein